jgi:hypothetical protein
MAGFLDKIKGMFGGKKAADEGAADDGDSKIDDIKETAGEVKDKVDDLVEKAGDKIPDQVKDVYDTVSDKVEDIIPGDKDNDGH